MTPSAAVWALLLSLVPQDTAPALGEQPPWVGVFDKLQLYGDLRLRHESSFELDDRSDSNRQRLRLRLGANYQLTNEVLVGARVVTGDRSDPNSPHVTLGEGFDDFELSLDRAFITYDPSWWRGSSATAGKFDHPFYRNPVYGELVWDADVQPEGVLAERRLIDVRGFESVDVVLGGYTLLEQGGGDDAQILAAELSGRTRLGKDTSGTIATSYYLYTDPTPDGATKLLTGNAGNSVVDTNGDGEPDEFVSDFGVWNTILGIEHDAWRLPLKLSGEYIRNTRAEIDRDEGWALGLAVGRSAERGDWRAYYQWQVVEQDSVFSPFAQDDFLFQTNHRSHVFGVNYQLRDNIGLHLWTLVSALDHTTATPTTDSGAYQWRVRLDLNVKL